MRQYDWLLFDVDGTLLDYEAAEAQALELAFTSADLPYDEAVAQAYRAINDAMWVDFEKGLLDQDVLKVQRFAVLFSELGYHGVDPMAFSQQYLGWLGSAAPLLPGALEAVQALGERHGMALITNGLREVQWPRLHSSGLRPHFDPVIISGDVGVSKPHPAIFAEALAQMGNASPDTVLIIGDSLTADMGGGARAGMDTCWMNPKGKPRVPDIVVTYEIGSLDELVRLLGEPNGTGKRIG